MSIDPDYPDKFRQKMSFGLLYKIRNEKFVSVIFCS